MRMTDPLALPTVSRQPTGILDVTDRNPLHETQPCPRCGRQHTASAYWDKVLGSPQGTKALEKPTLCCACGASLYVFCQLESGDHPLGWKWEIVKNEQEESSR